jgi:hypothetical protein
MKVSDEQIRAVAAELRGQGANVTGARVRRELDARFGARGGVTHIYRVLREAPAAAPAAPAEVPSSPSSGKMRIN